MEANKVIRLVAHKVVETVVRETAEWSNIVEEYKEWQAEEKRAIDKPVEEKRIGFKW